ncbi:uncharacterized protein VP01_3418g1 [Puccinia sorghi]|uniref:Uncharacterized protein n=1 Tax=Puccinia sorghi TaxID=27349 RepID=A0A0L6UWH7_9BASI|nr:uncharacterized protein VP01_3418g1 [Puccinia sorghi]
MIPSHMISRSQSSTQEPAIQHGKQSWRRTKKHGDKSKLDLIIDWLTVEGNYHLRRSGEMSKRDVCELILTYLANYSLKHQKRKWKGVGQQFSL